MKSIVLGSLTAALVLALSPVAQSKPVDLSEFPGKFTGTTTLVFNNSVYGGTSTMVFKVGKKGRDGGLAVTANVSAEGNAVDVSNSFGFAKNKTLTIAQFAPGVATASAAGTYSVRKSQITGVGTYMGADLGLSIKIKKTGKRATLTVVYTLSSGGVVVYAETFIGTGKLRK